MAEDIFVSRQAPGGPCCSAAAAAAAAASCTCHREVLAQTNFSDASRVYYETDSHSHRALSSRAPPPRAASTRDTAHTATPAPARAPLVDEER